VALDTGKKITRRNWDVIPMPDIVIKRVNTLDADQPEQMTFTDRHGRIIGDNDDMTNPMNDDFNLIEDDVDIPGVDIDEIPGVDIAEIPGVDMDNEILLPRRTQKMPQITPPMSHNQSHAA
jgi:hypothetical protein